MLEWLQRFREGLIKSHKSGQNYDPKWGRFPPWLRFNVDQVPLPFVLDKKTTYELPIGRNEKCWIATPGSGLDKRQASLQLCFSPENNKVRVYVIFRGTGKRIKAVEKKAYHESVDVYWQENGWADTEVSVQWVKNTLKAAIPEGEEFVLICDNLNAQTSDEFKEAVSGIGGIVYYGIPGEIFLPQYTFLE